MKIDGDSPAYPWQYDHGAPGWECGVGMTIRTAIAKDVLASIVGSPTHIAAINQLCSADGQKMLKLAAQTAALYADALIAELSKE